MTRSFQILFFVCFITQATLSLYVCSKAYLFGSDEHVPGHQRPNAMKYQCEVDQVEPEKSKFLFCAQFCVARFLVVGLSQ